MSFGGGEVSGGRPPDVQPFSPKEERLLEQGDQILQSQVGLLREQANRRNLLDPILFRLAGQTPTFSEAAPEQLDLGGGVTPKTPGELGVLIAKDTFLKELNNPANDVLKRIEILKQLNANASGEFPEVQALLNQSAAGFPALPAIPQGIPGLTPSPGFSGFPNVPGGIPSLIPQIPQNIPGLPPEINAALQAGLQNDPINTLRIFQQAQNAPNPAAAIQILQGLIGNAVNTPSSTLPGGGLNLPVGRSGVPSIPPVIPGLNLPVGRSEVPSIPPVIPRIVGRRPLPNVGNQPRLQPNRDIPTSTTPTFILPPAISLPVPGRIGPITPPVNEPSSAKSPDINNSLQLAIQNNPSQALQVINLARQASSPAQASKIIEQRLGIKGADATKIDTGRLQSSIAAALSQQSGGIDVQRVVANQQAQVQAAIAAQKAAINKARANIGLPPLP